SVQMPLFTKMTYNAPGRRRLKQLPNGRIVAETNYGRPPDIPAHVQILKETIPFPSKALEKIHGERIFADISKDFKCARGATLSAIKLGFRPLPKDGFPVVGTVPGAADIYVATTHQGVSLAPIMGRFVTQELLTGSLVDMLAPYRPERFL
ncbi:MAG: NAD(P)/FAD-dependent oxidoreductase, partial [Candidatus Binataceae bacterium]